MHASRNRQAVAQMQKSPALRPGSAISCTRVPVCVSGAIDSQMSRSLIVCASRCVSCCVHDRRSRRSVDHNLGNNFGDCKKGLTVSNHDTPHVGRFEAKSKPRCTISANKGDVANGYKHGAQSRKRQSLKWIA
jgi:hypothetical protein